MSTQSFLFLQQPSNLARFGLWTGYFFTINAVIGAGFLTLPHSFNKSGWLLAYIFMILIAIEVFYISTLLIDTMSRVECLTQLEELGISIKRPTFKQILNGTYKTETIPEEIVPLITDRRFDCSTMMGIVFGKRYGIGYMVLLYFFLTGSQVSYISIFASSFASLIPLGFSDTCNIYEDTEFIGDCRANYWIYLVIYSGFMMYLTIKGLREQRWMQSVLTVMRFIIIFMIVITCIALIASSSNIKNGDHVSFRMPQLINFRSLLSSLPNIIFAFIYQLQFPSIAEFVKDKEKNLRGIAKLVGLTSFVVYSLVAIIVPIAVHDVGEQCSIEYSNYSAGYSQSNRPWWTYIIAYIVVLFPAFDVFSSFPLMATAVADNLITISSGGTNEDFTDSIRQRNFRIFSVVVPVCISFFLFNLELIIGWVGMVGFVLVPISIPMLNVYIREMIHTHSVYDSGYYNKWVNLSVVLINAVLLIAIVVERIVTEASA